MRTYRTNYKLKFSQNPILSPGRLYKNAEDALQTVLEEKRVEQIGRLFPVLDRANVYKAATSAQAACRRRHQRPLLNYLIIPAAVWSSHENHEDLHVRNFDSSVQ